GSGDACASEESVVSKIAAARSKGRRKEAATPATGSVLMISSDQRTRFRQKNKGSLRCPNVTSLLKPATHAALLSLRRRKSQPQPPREAVLFNASPRRRAARARRDGG